MGFFFFLATGAKGVTCLLEHIQISGWEVSKKVGGFVLFVEPIKCKPRVLQQGIGVSLKDGSNDCVWTGKIVRIDKKAFCNDAH